MGQRQRQLLLLFAVAAVLAVGSNAQFPGPIGEPPACSGGRTFRVTCFTGPGGYLVDVLFKNSQRTTEVSVCDAPQAQLDQVAADTVELSAADAVVSFEACQDDSGVRGLVFNTRLGERLSCGAAGGHCVRFSSRSVYPLRGLVATCDAAGAAASRAGHAHAGPGKRPHYDAQAHSGDTAAQAWANSFTRVLSITSACWVPELPARAGGCPAGSAPSGGGGPCVPCAPSFFCEGGNAPALPCPSGTTTLTSGQSSCGCFPGEGVYGPRESDPEVCEECPAGSYSIGGTLAPCQPCATDAFAFLTSVPGSTSIADCSCAAGYGATTAQPAVCSMCERGYYSEGPLLRAELAMTQAAEPHAPVAPPWSHPQPGQPFTGRSSSSDSGAAGRTLQQINPIFGRPTFNPCTFCGPGCDTAQPGTTSPKGCVCVFISPAPSTPPVSPSPSTSPSPAPSPSPSPQPSESPSPGPSPSPSPSPALLPCVECDEGRITSYLQQSCGNKAFKFNLLDPQLNLCSNTGGATLTTFVTEPNTIFDRPTESIVNCALINAAATNQAILFIDGTAPDASCNMPSVYQDLTIPFVPPTSPAPARRVGPGPAPPRRAQPKAARQRQRRVPGG